MRYSFHPEAVNEINEAVDYFEEVESGFGFDFATEVHFAIERIMAFPKAWPLLENDIHRCLVRRFPYGIVYSVEKEIIIIIAVMHLHRNPDYWKHRT
jgi:hypothetical protein